MVLSTPSSLNTTPSKKHGFLQNSTKFRKLVTGFESSGSRLVSGGRGVDSDLESAVYGGGKSDGKVRVFKGGAASDSSAVFKEAEDEQ